MRKVLVAGATGYLGGFVVKALKARGYWVRTLSRNTAKLDSINECVDEVFIGEVTQPKSLNGLCNDIDVVISSIGITRQKDGFTYWNVDYQGNKNLLDIAQKASVSKFIYVHILNAQQLQHVAGVRAKQAFVDDLKQSGQDYTVVCPTGFFSDMGEFLEMARSGRVYLLGDGRSRINPIHGADLAEVCVDAIDSSERRIDVGGPEVWTYVQITELAFDALGKPPKMTRVSNRLVKAGVRVLRWLTPAKTYGPVEFFASVMTIDMVGKPHGKRRLDEFYRNRASRNKNDSS